MSPKFFIAYASIGSGHFSAAKALEAAVHRKNAHAQVILYDIFAGQKTRTGFGNFISALSTLFFPGLYSWIWSSGSFAGVFDLIRRLPLISKPLIRAVDESSPDAVICTHALPCAVLTAHLQDIPLMAVTTDFRVHPYWSLSGVDAYIVASNAAGAELQRRGVPAKRIFPVGIPIQSSIQPADKSSANNDLPGPLRVLILAGARQTGPYLPVYRSLIRLMDIISSTSPGQIQWEWVFGRGEWLRRQAQKRMSGCRNVEMFSYVDDMPHHLARADLVITKPGGLILAEAFALGKPVLFPVQSAGQEAANCAAVLKAGAGLLETKPAGLYQQVRMFSENRGELKVFQQRACQLGKPDAAADTIAILDTLE